MLREPFTFEAVDDNPSATPCPDREATLVDPAAFKRALQLASQAQRGMLIVGHLPTEAIQAAATSLATALNWPIWADIRSGLHHESRCIQSRCALSHMLATPAAERTIEPDLIIHLGGGVVSKAILDYLQHEFSGAYIRASGDDRKPDPTGRATLSINGDLILFCEALSQQTAALQANGFIPQHAEAHASPVTQLEELSKADTALSEPTIGYLLSKHLVPGSGLFIGNSMPVRFCDRFAIGDHPPEQVSANRGVSGIDGTIATAVGFCTGLNRPTVCLLGDVSFIHDLNSLSQLSQLTTPMILIVVNNSGGGIFHHLPISQHGDVFDEFFVTPHTYQFEDAARQFAIPYSRAETNGEFIDQLRSAQRRKAHALIELTVDQQTNMGVYEGLGCYP